MEEFNGTYSDLNAIEKHDAEIMKTLGFYYYYCAT